MPTYDATIEDFAVGDDIDIVRTITNIPSGQTLTNAVFTVKSLEAATAALFTKTVTTSASDSGIIENGSGTATVTFSVTAEDTVLLSPGNYHYYWIEITTSAEKTYTPEKGKIRGVAGA